MADRPQTIAYPAPDARPRPRSRETEPLAPHVIVLFGATGDLAKRKLLPGMAYLAQSSLAPDIRVVGTAMDDMSTDEFRALARRSVESFGTHKVDDGAWAQFAERLTYVPQGTGPEGRSSCRGRAGSLPRQMSFASDFGLTRFRNGTNQPPIAHPLPQRRFSTPSGRRFS